MLDKSVVNNIRSNFARKAAGKRQGSTETIIKSIKQNVICDTRRPLQRSVVTLATNANIRKLIGYILHSTGFH